MTLMVMNTIIKTESKLLFPNNLTNTVKFIENLLKGKWSSGQRVKTVPGCFSLFVIHLKTHCISSLK